MQNQEEKKKVSSQWKEFVFIEEKILRSTQYI